ncbi:MAG: acyl carrier protein [Pseudomonadales bacterium]
MDAVASNIAQYIIDELLYAEPVEQLDADAELLASGMLDSMATAQLMVHLESEFTIKLQPTDLTFDNFNTIAALTAMVDRYRSA